MGLKKIIFFYLLFLTKLIVGQDILYTNKGTKLEVKVLEINLTNIKYKNYSYLTGPTYVISKSDIVLIKYQNNTTDIITERPERVFPLSASQKVDTDTIKNKPLPTKTKPIYYVNTNFLSINALALSNGDITLFYDKELLNGKLGLSFMGGYNFNTHMGGLNALIVSSFHHTKKLYDAGLGLNFFPQQHRRSQYFIGLQSKYMRFKYDAVNDTTNNQLHYTPKQGQQIALMITNGWQYRVSTNFSFKFFVCIGAVNNTPSLKSYRNRNSTTKTDLNDYPKIYLGYCFGYRF